MVCPHSGLLLGHEEAWRPGAGRTLTTCAEGETPTRPHGSLFCAVSRTTTSRPRRGSEVARGDGGACRLTA